MRFIYLSTTCWWLLLSLSLALDETSGLVAEGKMKSRVCAGYCESNRRYTWIDRDQERVRKLFHS